MGCIYKRGRVYWIKYSRGGRGYYESSGSTKHEDAKRFLRLREGDIERGVPVTPRIGRLRFSEAAEGIVTEYRTNGRKTIGHVERRIRLHLEPFFGGRRMASITTADTRRFVDQRQAAGASNQPGARNPEADVLAGDARRDAADTAPHPDAGGAQRPDRVLQS